MSEPSGQDIQTAYNHMDKYPDEGLSPEIANYMRDTALRYRVALQQIEAFGRWGHQYREIAAEALQMDTSLDYEGLGFDNNGELITDYESTNDPRLEQTEDGKSKMTNNKIVNHTGDSQYEMKIAMALAGDNQEMKGQLNRLWIIIESIETDNMVKSDIITNITTEIVKSKVLYTEALHSAKDAIKLCEKYDFQLTNIRVDEARLRDVCEKFESSQLRTLADWITLQTPNNLDHLVQEKLRSWADAIDQALSEKRSI